jgi:hypothetical protein
MTILVVFCLDIAAILELELYCGLVTLLGLLGLCCLSGDVVEAEWHNMR